MPEWAHDVLRVAGALFWGGLGLAIFLSALGSALKRLFRP